MEIHYSRRMQEEESKKPDQATKANNEGGMMDDIVKWVGGMMISVIAYFLKDAHDKAKTADSRISSLERDHISRHEYREDMLEMRTMVRDGFKEVLEELGKKANRRSTDV